MKPPRTYSTPEAFRVALEERVKASARALGHADATRRRQLLLADRLLARLTLAFGDALVAKGGIALELRLPDARATRDVDLLLSGAPSQLPERLQAACAQDMGDWLRFTVSTSPEDIDTIEAEGLPYEGFRFRVAAFLGDKPYGDRFGLDIVFGGAPVGDVTLAEGLSVMDFAGVAPGRYRLYPRELHLAEKLHAYTLPRPRPNGRVKDLPDMALLARTGSFHASAIRAALVHTFQQRGTHPVPSALPAPPAGLWQAPYSRLARLNRLRWKSLDEVLAAARAFVDPVLDGMDGLWNPAEGLWRG